MRSSQKHNNTSRKDTIRVWCRKVENINLRLHVKFTILYFQTANALSFLLYNLSRNPSVQEKLISEIRRTLKPTEGVSVDVIEHLPYMKACVKESFR